MVVIVKLVSNVEVAGEIEFENNTVIGLKNPVTIVYKQMLSGTPSISFAPYSPFVEEDVVTFRHKDVINVMKPSPVFEQYYAVVVENTNNTKQFLIDELSSMLGLPVEEKTLTWENDREEIYKKLLEQLPAPTANTVLN